MNKLIVQHGERVTEHPIGERPLVVGRDPQCDLFFADKKLSRRHARFELEDDRVRIVDLGSRNGCWVNEERVEDRLLSPNDSVRLGGLHVSIDLEPAPVVEPAEPAEDDSTVYLSGSDSADDSSTVVLSSAALPDAPPPTGTVALSPDASPLADASEEDEDPTLRRPDDRPPSDRRLDSGVDRTVIYSGDRPRAETDTGTVIFRGKTAPQIDASTRSVPAEKPAAPPALPRPPGNVAPTVEIARSDATRFAVETDDSVWEQDISVRATSQRSLRYAVLVAAIAALAFVVLAMPLLRTLGSALAAESALRGRALVELLAVSNVTALREGRTATLSVTRVAQEPGVEAAFILGPSGAVLAPQDHSGLSASIRASLGDTSLIRDFRERELGDGTVVLAQPMITEARSLGVAVIRYRVGAVSSWTITMLLFGSLLFLMGLAAAVIVARRWTLEPVQELRNDVEALRNGIVQSLAEERPYADLASIARSFNELLRRRGPRASGSASVTYRPMVDPTLVPDEQEQAEADR